MVMLIRGAREGVFELHDVILHLSQLVIISGLLLINLRLHLRVLVS